MRENQYQYPNLKDKQEKLVHSKSCRQMSFVKATTYLPMTILMIS